MFFDISSDVGHEHRRYVPAVHVSHNGVHAVFRFNQIPVVVSSSSSSSSTIDGENEHFERIDWVSREECFAEFNYLQTNGSQIFGDRLLLLMSLNATSRHAGDASGAVYVDNEEENTSGSYGYGNHLMLHAIRTSWPDSILMFNHSPSHIWQAFLAYVLKKPSIKIYSVRATSVVATEDTIQYIFRIFVDSVNIAVKACSSRGAKRYVNPRLLHVHKIFNECIDEHNPFLVHRGFMLSNVYSHILSL